MCFSAVLLLPLLSAGDFKLFLLFYISFTSGGPFMLGAVRAESSLLSLQSRQTVDERN